MAETRHFLRCHLHSFTVKEDGPLRTTKGIQEKVEIVPVDPSEDLNVALVRLHLIAGLRFVQKFLANQLCLLFTIIWLLLQEKYSILL